MLLPRRLSPGESVTPISAGGLNAALRDPAVRAIAVTAGHRDLDDLDLNAVRADPKPIVGIGTTTFVHLELWRTCGLAGIHGDTADLTHADPVTLHRAGDGVHVPGRASGVLLGGNLAAVRAMIGAGLPELRNAILLLTGDRTQGLGQVDRQLTHLRRAGILDRVRAVAVGTFTGFEGHVDRDWTLADVLQDQLGRLTVPILSVRTAGVAVPVGTSADLDADRGTLTVGAGVR